MQRTPTQQQCASPVGAVRDRGPERDPDRGRPRSLPSPATARSPELRRAVGQSPGVLLHVALVDRSDLFRESLAGLLVSRGHRVVMSVAVGHGMADVLDRCPLDAILLDAAAAEGVPVDGIRRLRSDRPDLRVLVMHADGPDPRGNLAPGLVDGVVDRTAGLVQLERAVSGMPSSAPAPAPAPPGTVPPPRRVVPTLTRRETEVLTLLERGCSTRVIAASLGVASSTVYAHVRALLHKSGARTRLELVTGHVRGDDLGHAGRAAG